MQQNIKGQLFSEEENLGELEQILEVLLAEKLIIKIDEERGFAYSKVKK